MRNKKINQPSRVVQWAQFRFSVIGALLSSPPEHGRLKKEVRLLSEKVWRHPITQNEFQIGASTIERWFYRAQKQTNNPINDLETKRRKDTGRFKGINQEVIIQLQALYVKYPYWSYQLLFENLQAWALKQEPRVEIPSCATIFRLCKAKGWIRQKNAARRDDGSPLPNALKAQEHHKNFEIRSYEHEFVGGLWHFDFHKGSRKVLLNDGTWVTPSLLSVIDDSSRLICHAQWYLFENTESLVHGLTQAFQKRGLPRQIMSDNGSAMTSAEFTQGLSRLSIIHNLTLFYSPHQNGKQERFWGTIEGRFMSMLYDVSGITLNQLNDWTQMWVESDYHNNIHSELKQKPVDRFLYTKNVLRDSPDVEVFKQAFTYEDKRCQRQTDGTIQILGIRFEVPSAYRHHKTLWVRVASWDLSYVYLCHPETRKPVNKLYPLNKIKNATGIRRKHLALNSNQPEKSIVVQNLPPLLKKIIQDYQLKGFPPAYIRQDFNEDQTANVENNENVEDKNEFE